MDVFFEPHRILLQALLDFNVDFIVVGGYAVNLYGYNRPTGDMDLWLNPTVINKQKLLKMLHQNGFDNDSLAYIYSVDFTKPLVFSIGEAPLKIDFLTQVNLVEYDKANAQKNIVNIDGLSIPFIHLNDLVLSKINTGRLKDQADIEELQKIQTLQKKNHN